MASQSMAYYWKTAGWVVLAAWWLSPIISLLVNKLIPYLFSNVFSDVSRKFHILKTITVPDLEKTLRNVQEQRMRRLFRDSNDESLAAINKLAKVLEEDLKSALYEAEEIMDLVVDYHRAEEEAVGRTSSWVQQRLAAARACFAGCFRRSWVWLRPWIDVTRAAVLKCALRLYQLGRSTIQGLLSKMLSAVDINRATKLLQLQRRPGTSSATPTTAATEEATAGAAARQSQAEKLLGHVSRSRAKLLQWADRLLWQHLGKFKRATLLPVSIQTSSSNESTGSLVGPVTSSPSASQTAFGATTTETDVPGELGTHKPPLLRPAQKVEVVDEEEEKVEEEKVKEEEEQEEVKGEIEEQKEEEEKKAEEIEVEEEKNKEETEEQNEEIEEQKEAEEEEEIEEEEEEEDDEDGAPWLCVRQCFQCMPTWLIDAIKYVRTVRDWSYKVVGIESNQRGKIAEYSLFPPFGANSLSKRIQHIENILDDSKKSYLLNQQSGNSKESSSSELSINDTKKESSSRKEQIDILDRGIERKVFGRNKELEYICKMFRKGPCGHGSKTYSVLGIHGIAGSGKSTLANYVCDHEKKAEDKHFDHIMFSHVSVNFRLDKIFRDMLREDQPSDSNDEGVLCRKLKEKLKGKRFLLVLDDLWVNDDNQKELDILLDALNAGQNGSIIIVTARRDDAAAALGAEEQISITDLEEEEYLSLFMHHALQGAVHDKGEFERIGKIIVEKLHRSPIAAVTVARQLQKNKTIKFWEKTANLDVLSKTMGALWWSYQQLEVDIRRCFAYCSTFPAGYKLERDVLVRIWIAQGFVSTTGNTTEEMEDVGDRYFDELVKSSFLQVGREGIIEEFTIHDLLRELAERVAGSDFFRIDDDMMSGLPPAEDIPRGVRHLFIRSKNAAQDAQTAEKNLDLGNLRTLIIDETYSRSTSRKQRRHGLEKIFKRLFMRLRKLRVLIIQLPGGYPEGWSLPASIGQMKDLRYFSFDCPFYDRSVKLILPRTFSKLYQMQTIFFSFHFETVSYPDGMANLIRLRHVSGLHDVPNISRMTSLQTMRTVVVKKEQGYELKQLKQLNKLRGTLRIFGLENVGSKEEAPEADLARKKRVTDLGLYFDLGLCFDLDGRTNNPDIEAEVLEGLCPPKDLQELTIQRYRGSRYPSWMLERGQQHPHAPKHLRRLKLIHCSCPLASFPEDSELFKNLHELLISGWEQDSLPENMERLVSLQSLSIVGCRHISAMELGPTLPRSLRKIWIYESNLVLGNMEHIMSLEDLGICSCDKIEVLPKLPQSLKEIYISGEVLGRTCEEKEHENWHKIQHIGYRAISYGNKTTIYRPS